MKKIIGWICSIFMLLSTMVFYPSVGSIIFLISGLLALPTNKWQAVLMGKIKLNKAIKQILIAVLFFGGVFTVPLDDSISVTSELAQETTAIASSETAEIITEDVIQTVEATVPETTVPKVIVENQIETVEFVEETTTEAETIYWTVSSYSYKKARYTGRLKQMTAYSMSRQSILDHKEELKAYLGQYKDIHKLITFKKYEEELNGIGLHFGNAEGIDEFKGQNLIVVGTPHVPDFIYRLIGFHLGMAVNDESLTPRRVEHHGYSFTIMTYKDKNMQNLQLYMIGKELEQCVDRARLLRYDCEVLVLSNYPCEQAELIQDEYLGVTEV